MKTMISLITFPLVHTEFENLQQLKAIDSEREKILGCVLKFPHVMSVWIQISHPHYPATAYQQRIESNEIESKKLKEQTVVEDEKAARFRKQHAINKDNIERWLHVNVNTVQQKYRHCAII